MWKGIRMSSLSCLLFFSFWILPLLFSSSNIMFLIQSRCVCLRFSVWVLFSMSAVLPAVWANFFFFRCCCFCFSYVFKIFTVYIECKLRLFQFRQIDHFENLHVHSILDLVQENDVSTWCEWEGNCSVYTMRNMCTGLNFWSQDECDENEMRWETDEKKNRTWYKRAYTQQNV